MIRRQLLIAALLAAVHAVFFLSAGPVDDELICWRYARNLVRGDGPVFNPGEWIQGYTCPLWVAIHALGQAVGIGPLWVCRGVGAFSFAWATWSAGAVYHRRQPGAPVLWPAFVVAASPALAFHTAAGLGTVLLAALLIAALNAWDAADLHERTPLRAALWLGLAAGVRPEALLFCGLASMVWLTQRRGYGRRLVLVGLALGPALVALGYARLAYGAWLPHTYGIKKLPVLYDLGYGLRYLIESSWVTGAGLWVLLALGALRLTGPMRVMTLGVVLHTLYVVFVGGDYLAQARFFVPTLPLAIALACTAHAAARWGLPVIVLLGMFGPQWAQLPLRGNGPFVEHTRPYLRALHEFQEQRWAQLGRVLGAAASPGTKVAISPLGAFGWESDLVLYDPLGLVVREVAAAEPDLEVELKGHHRHDGEAILARRPDWIVLGNGVRDPQTGKLNINPWERSLVSAEGFQRDYERFRLDIEDGAPLDLWVRRGSQTPAGALKIGP